uniref:CX domain-containing protein n=1 Tax=Schistosoma mansoni TaxID=6183 RepID=A0A5K4EW59_SCHMA
MRLLPIFVVLLLLYDEILAKPKSKGFGLSKRPSISKPKYRYSGRSSVFSRRSGLSNSRKKALFFAAGALAGVYIGSRMRSHVHLRSYRDLYNYEVCEGQRTEFINSTGMTRTYSYFLCPDNPNQPFEKYCCWDSTTGMGACCSYDVKMGVVVGTLLGTMLLIITFGSTIYCCFRCKRRKERESLNVPSAQFTSPLDPVYKPVSKSRSLSESSDSSTVENQPLNSGNQYPVVNPTSVPPGYPVYPYPPNGQYVGYPQNVDVPFAPVPPALPTNMTGEAGSSWGVETNLPYPTTRPDFPPPPYPGASISNAEVHASAPSSTWMTKS